MLNWERSLLRTLITCTELASLASLFIHSRMIKLYEFLHDVEEQALILQESETIYSPVESVQRTLELAELSASDGM